MLDSASASPSGGADDCYEGAKYQADVRRYRGGAASKVLEEDVGARVEFLQIGQHGEFCCA